MQVGYVMCAPGLGQVLCLTEDKTGVWLQDVDSTLVLNQAICLSDLTEIKNVYQRLRDAGLIDCLEVTNIAKLYKKFY